MNEIEQIVKVPNVVIEVGHAKQGSTHIMIVKKLRVGDDDLNTAINRLEEALKRLHQIIEV
tara:strand:- start:259 stop:441 length:183 start_codon:yes stop_codon:yes gene_type:complete